MMEMSKETTLFRPSDQHAQQKNEECVRQLHCPGNYPVPEKGFPNPENPMFQRKETTIATRMIF